MISSGFNINIKLGSIKTVSMAKEQYCPLSMGCGKDKARCIGSACACWVWLDNIHSFADEYDHNIKNLLYRIKRKYGEDLSSLGFCGL